MHRWAPPWTGHTYTHTHIHTCWDNGDASVHFMCTFLGCRGKPDDPEKTSINMGWRCISTQTVAPAGNRLFFFLQILFLSYCVTLHTHVVTKRCHPRTCSTYFATQVNYSRIVRHVGSVFTDKKWFENDPIPQSNIHHLQTQVPQSRRVGMTLSAHEQTPVFSTWVLSLSVESAELGKSDITTEVKQWP